VQRPPQRAIALFDLAQSRSLLQNSFRPIIRLLDNRPSLTDERLPSGDSELIKQLLLPFFFHVTIQALSGTIPGTTSMAKSLDISPVKSFAEEVEILRKSFRACLDVYTQRIETELKEIKDAALAQSNGSQVPANKIRDLRDMIILCRTLDIKPEKGRRKDLKKIDSLIDELHLMIENWR
jgi:hypothetical protein